MCHFYPRQLVSVHPFLSPVNYCSHSSRGVKWGQLRVPGWLSQTGTLERHSGDWGARETESWNCRGRDARAHGRFSSPAYWGAPRLSPKPDHRVERSYVSAVIGEKTVKQRPSLLFFLFFIFCFLLSRLCGCRYWCEPEERFFRWAARDGGARRQEETTFTLMWEDYLPPTLGAQMKGKCCALTAAAVKTTAPWPRQEKEWSTVTDSRASRQHRQPALTLKQLQQPARAPRLSLSPLVSARAASCVHNIKNLLTVRSASCAAHLWLRFFLSFFLH